MQFWSMQGSQCNSNQEMSSSKADLGSKVGLPFHHSATGSLNSINNLDDDLPLVGRRRQGSTLFRPCLTTAFGLCIVSLVVVVVYLVVTNCLVQRQMNAVQLEMVGLNRRLDWVMKENQELQMHAGNKKPLRDAKNMGISSYSLTDEKQNLSTNEVHRLRKRDVSKTSPTKPKSVRPKKKNTDRELTDSAESSRQPESMRSKREKRALKKRLDEVEGQLNALKQAYQQDMNNLAHPSARMVLPVTKPSVARTDNIVVWGIEHNALFETAHAASAAHFTVKTPGAYFVYLQVTYNGQDGLRSNPTCSHIVKLENAQNTNRSKLLLYGSTTQYNLGGLIRLPVSGHEIKAIDSVHVSGVFHLIPDDVLFVAPDEFSRDCIVSDFNDKTFFGAFLLQSSFQQHQINYGSGDTA